MADGRGIRIMRVEGVGKVSLISIVDVVSRLKAESYPSLETTSPALPDYQLTLRRAFLTYGLPETLTLDRGTVFYDNTTPSPFPTRLHVWLLALGVQVRFTRHPLSHRSRDHRADPSDDDSSGTAGTNLPIPCRRCRAGLDERRQVLNRHLPSRALAHQAPIARLSASYTLGTIVPP
jgi:hypothetical protein